MNLLSFGGGENAVRGWNDKQTTTHHLHNRNRLLDADDLIEVLYVDRCEVVA
jgi:hypothetical protein